MDDNEMTEGYRDGFDDTRGELPGSLANRSHSYRHGWQNGRDDRLMKPRAPAWKIRDAAANAIAADQGNAP